MTITVKHKFTCSIPDDPDTSLVRPSNWNDTHDLTGFGTAAEADTADFVSASDIRITNWDTAFSWGNHAAAGYLTSFTESDPVFNASAAASITTTNISNWNSAFSWGDHSAAGYVQLPIVSSVYTLSGKFACGDSITVGKLTSNGPRSLSLIDSQALMRIWRPSGDPGLEFVRGTVENVFSSSNTYWDIALVGAGLQFRNRSYGAAISKLLTFTNNNLNVGFLLESVDAATRSIGIGGEVNRTFGLERRRAANSTGSNLEIMAGDATVGGTDKNGGTLVIRSGIATGTGESGVQIQTAKSGASGTADRTPTTIIEALGDKLAFNGATPINKPTVTGSRGGNAALASLLTALAQLGLITDSTTA